MQTSKLACDASTVEVKMVSVNIFNLFTVRKTEDNFFFVRGVT